ncbi:MAG: hypothetical protein HQL52_15990 [Magnetococcales bacterium]|nr:hypothetical protein [Magnetococcales bacterium]
MAGLLTKTTLTDQQRSRNDAQHNHGVVVLVLWLLLLYIYLFTYVPQTLHLPMPQELAQELGVALDHVFDRDLNIHSHVNISWTQRFDSNESERLILFYTILGSFLSAYYLPLRFKRPALVFWTLGAVGLLYGLPATSGLVMAHGALWLTFHPQPKHPLIKGGSLGLLAWVSFWQGEPLYPAVVLSLGFGGFYRFLWLPWLARPKTAPLLRTLLVQSALITVVGSALIEGLDGGSWKLPLGVVLFFWHWQRVMLYQVDFNDGLVPKDLGFLAYLAVFISPGALPNWNREAMIGQGYSYINGVFLHEPKNRIVLAGVRILWVALAYLVLGNWLWRFLVDLCTGWGVDVFDAHIREMTRHYLAGKPLTTSSVLLTTLLDLFRWVTIYASITHFKVGLWRICGYGVDANFDKPWLATNLVAFWKRFTFHYREFLARVFFYPLFFRFRRQGRKTRIITATLGAIVVGNLIWGHVVELFFYRGMAWDELDYFAQAWPYFILLGGGIALTELYLLQKKSTRQPWQWGPWLMGDVVASYLTLQFYALIHIFIFPVAGASVGDLFRLFLIGFGIHL